MEARLKVSTDVGVAALLTRAASQLPDAIALKEAESGRRTTWSELDALASAAADGLSRAGLVAGHRVMLALGNRLEFVAAYLGALRGGLVVVPVNPRSAVGELSRMLADSGSRVVVTDPGTQALVGSALADLAQVDPSATPPRVVVAGEESWEALVAEPGRPAPGPVDPESVAVLLYTSGTSGRPRAAMLTHRALLANIDQVAQVEPPMIGADDLVLGVLPLFHVYGLNAVLGQVLRTGCRLLLVGEFRPSTAVDLIVEHGVTVLPVAPPVFAYWRSTPEVAERLRAAGTLRMTLSGSAPLSPELITWFTESTGVPVHQGYGLTEAAPVVTSTLCSSTPQPGSVGAALPGVELRLVEETGRPPEGDDPGEIWVRGDNLFSGYWPDGSDGPDAEGWYATGDIGFLDETGDLFLVDRLKELVIVSGFNVYPREVEEVVGELPEVGEVAVIGAPDERTGEAVVAYVTAAAGASEADRAALADRVRQHCEVRLARFKQPSVVHAVAELPFTVTGKVQKGRLRAAERRRSLGLLE